MTEPVRVQRRREKGWTTPDGTVYVGRPTKYGNPFVYRTPVALARVPALDGSAWEYEGRISADGMRHDFHHGDGRVTRHDIRYMTRAETVELYEKALLHPTQALRLWVRRGGEMTRVTPETVREELAGKDLSCWCSLTDVCHADVLLRVANS